jgi:excisionase family DNA binding protein
MTQPLQLITKRELADALAVSPRTIERMVAKGEITAFYLGRAVRFDAATAADELRRAQAAKGGE